MDVAIRGLQGEETRSSAAAGGGTCRANRTPTLREEAEFVHPPGAFLFHEAEEDGVDRRMRRARHPGLPPELGEPAPRAPGHRGRAHELDLAYLEAPKEIPERCVGLADREGGTVQALEAEPDPALGQETGELFGISLPEGRSKAPGHVLDLGPRGI
jgi:hypothetical protein